jgi:hypothetical protein
MSLPSFMSVFSFKLRESTTPKCGGDLTVSASVPRDKLRGTKFVEPLFENPKWGELVNECGWVGVGASELAADCVRDWVCRSAGEGEVREVEVRGLEPRERPED